VHNIGGNMANSVTRKRVAVVGSGLAGLVSAVRAYRQHDITLIGTY
jgi:predicted NAD/FAD-binding protein